MGEVSTIGLDRAKSVFQVRAPACDDFNAAPEFIRQIEIDQTVMLGEANRDLALRAIKLRLRFDHIEGSVERARARRVPGPLVVLLAQPGTKAFAANWPGFPVAVDDELPAHGRGADLWRKPKPGMILQAAPDLDLNLAGSAMVGNSLDDMKAASAAGVGLRILLGSCDDITALDGPMQDVADLAAALALLRARMQSDG